MLLAVISALEGLALVIYAVLSIINAIVVGPTGPEAVSNTTAITLEIVIFAFLGAGLLATAWGWWRVKRWARAPFLLGQLIALVVGFPLVQATGTIRASGALILVAGIVGIVVALLPKVTDALLNREILDYES